MKGQPLSMKDLIDLASDMGIGPEVKEFFDHHVCTPKGENPNPLAELIHAYAEGAEIQKLTKINPTWIDDNYPNFSGTFDWRLKVENKLTQREVFDALKKEAFIRIAGRNMYPDNDKTVDRMQRESTMYAVAHTWYWFNNQTEFLKKKFF